MTADITQDQGSHWSTDDYLAATASMLVAAGEKQAAALITEVVEFSWQSDEYDDTDSITLRVWPHYAVERFTPHILEAITNTLGVMLNTEEGVRITWTRVVPAVRPAAEGWRDELFDQLGAGPIANQASIGPPPPEWLRRDRLNFRQQAEVALYEALKEWQAELPAQETIGILPGAGVRVVGHTFELDCLVTLRGRQLDIEVDGATHYRKLVSDHSRHQLLTDAGIDVIRIDIADAMDPDELDAFMLRVKARLQA
jgi:hypothetical protein